MWNFQNIVMKFQGNSESFFFGLKVKILNWVYENNSEKILKTFHKNVEQVLIWL